MIYNKIIIDGLNLCHKYKWVHRDMVNKNGENTGVIYGFIDFCLNYYNKYPGVEIIVAWDSPRLKKKSSDPNYKSDRAEAAKNRTEDEKKYNNDLHSQIHQLKDLLSLYGVTQYFAVGYEADDIAAKIVKESKKQRILLVSSDTDWFMMMNRKTDVWSKGQIKKLDDVLVEIDFSNLDEYRIFLSITGTHNNVKGIPYIYTKPTKEIIKSSANIKDLFKKKDFNKSTLKVHQKIINNMDLVIHNYELIDFIVDGYDFEEIKINKNIEKLTKILIEKYNMKSLPSRLSGFNGLEDF